LTSVSGLGAFADPHRLKPVPLEPVSPKVFSKGKIHVD